MQELSMQLVHCWQSESKLYCIDEPKTWVPLVFTAADKQYGLSGWLTYKTLHFFTVSYCITALLFLCLSLFPES